MNATTEQAEAVVEGLQYQSFAVEVIADDSGKFVGNGMRYGTREAAHAAGRSLMSRWMLVREIRVVPSTDAPNT